MREHHHHHHRQTVSASHALRSVSRGLGGEMLLLQFYFTVLFYYNYYYLFILQQYFKENFYFYLKSKHFKMALLFYSFHLIIWSILQYYCKMFIYLIILFWGVFLSITFLLILQDYKYHVKKILMYIYTHSPQRVCVTYSLILCIRKVFIALHFFHISLWYSLIPKWILFIISAKFYKQYPIMTTWKKCVSNLQTHTRL